MNYQALMQEQNAQANFNDLDPEFLPIYNQVREFTMTSVERLFGLYKAVEYIARNQIPGDFLECGVWRGGSMMLVALVAQKFNLLNRQIILYDTFAGHTVEPDKSLDVGIFGDNGYNDFQARRGTPWAAASLEEVQANMALTGFPQDQILYFPGDATISIPETNDCIRSLSLLRLDMDWYAPTKVALETLYPDLVPNGVIIFDDYGHYLGQRKCADEFFATQFPSPLLHRLDYSCRIGIKLEDLR